MAAPTYSWNSITASQCDADSPLDETLMEALRQNAIHTEEWLGDGYTAAKDHSHNNVDSALISDLGANVVGSDSMSYAAGDVLVVSADSETIQNNDTYTLVKEIVLARSGTLRIKFDLSLAIGGAACYGKIYRNGSPVGTERSTTSTSYVTFSEDISGWTAGDLCQLYTKKTAAGPQVKARNFRLYNEYPVVESVNLD